MRFYIIECMAKKKQKKNNQKFYICVKMPPFRQQNCLVIESIGRLNETSHLWLVTQLLTRSSYVCIYSSKPPHNIW